MQHQSFDIMHDILEGVIPTLLRHIFIYCIDQKLLKKTEIQDRVRDFNYGIHLRKSKPSFLDLDSPNLNQNASQNYCLMINTPFILLDLKNELSGIWSSVQSLLIIMRIVFSNVIHENDVKLLDESVEQFLESFINNFNAPLKPKFHFLTHYARSIRASGPIKMFWMMRMDAKHKFFTNWIAKQKNHKNITQTLSNKHQEIMLSNCDSYKDKIVKQKNHKVLVDIELISKIEAEVQSTSDWHPINFFRFNGIEYRIGFLIIENNKFFEIKNIISNDNCTFHFICSPIEVENFNPFCNSFEIKRCEVPSDHQIIPLGRLLNKNTYEIVYYKRQCFVKIETLDLRVESFIK